tara:strand:+ start:34 stop:693 length:660 start_codon:yes stop_codon:yes gene_type:complete
MSDGYYRMDIEGAAVDAGTAEWGDQQSSYMTRRLLHNFFRKLGGKVIRNYRKYGGEVKFQQEINNSLVLQPILEDAPSTEVAVVPIDTTVDDDPILARLDARIAKAEAEKVEHLIKKNAPATRKDVMATALHEVEAMPPPWKYLAVSDYMEREGIRGFTTPEISVMGRHLTRICKAHMLGIRSTFHPKFDKMNTYPERALELYFERVRIGMDAQDLDIA